MEESAGTLAQSSTLVANISYFLSVAALTGVLIWGLKHVSRELKRVGCERANLYGKALSEKRVSPADAVPLGNPEAPSFSRVASSLGAVGLAAAFVGIGYWALHELFFGNDLEKISGLSSYFLAGSALSIPCAFNTL
jgi:hypothetical protein